MAVVATSCVSRKEITYFQPKDEKSDLEKLDIKDNFILKLQAGDILSVMVYSLSPEANAMFNVYPQQLNTSVQPNTTTPAIGFLVDTDGNITLPLAGKIPVLGLSNKEASDTITKHLDKYLQQPTVNVRLLNFKISVLGEVNRPSVYTISNERVTLPEAISLAGDLTVFGKRENVLIIREINGVREFIRVDLTKRDLFSSPYYYLRPNDIVYVEQKRGKRTNTSPAVQLAPIFISAATLSILILQNLLK